MVQTVKAVTNCDDKFLDVSNVTKRYNKTVALNDCSIHIAPGEVLGLIGGNGAGKSTLTRVISGITRPDECSLTISGDDIPLESFNAHSASRLGIKVVYQELSLCTNLTVSENFYIDLDNVFKGSMKWRKKAKEIAKKKALKIYFPIAE